MTVTKHRGPDGSRYHSTGSDQQAHAGEQSVWHLTSDPRFALDAERVPAANYLSITGYDDVPGLYVTDNVERWVNGYGYLRPFAVELRVTGPVKWGNANHPGGMSQSFIPADQFDRVEVVRVIPIDEYVHEVYQDRGWVEEWHEPTEWVWDQPRPVSPYPEGYHYEGPDVRSMSDEEVQRLIERTEEAQAGRSPAYAKHYGPGDHPGTGTPQTEHGRSDGERHWSLPPDKVTYRAPTWWQRPEWLQAELDSVRPGFWEASGVTGVTLDVTDAGGGYSPLDRTVTIGMTSLLPGESLTAAEFRQTLAHELAHGIIADMMDQYMFSYSDPGDMEALTLRKGLETYWQEARYVDPGGLRLSEQLVERRTEQLEGWWVRALEQGDPWAYPRYERPELREFLAEAFAYIETGHADLVRALDAEVGEVEGLPGGIMGLWDRVVGLPVPDLAVMKHPGHTHGMPVPCLTSDVAKHYGPGPHPGTGTPQTVHSVHGGIEAKVRERVAQLHWVREPVKADLDRFHAELQQRGAWNALVASVETDGDLTWDQATALMAWQRIGNWQAIRDALDMPRGRAWPAEVDVEGGDVDWLMRNLDEAIAKSRTTRPVRVHRGYSLDMPWHRRERPQVGDVFENPNYTATTVTEDQALKYAADRSDLFHHDLPVVFGINLPVGTPIAVMPPQASFREAVLPRGAKFKVVDVKERYWNQPGAVPSSLRDHIPPSHLYVELDLVSDFQVRKHYGPGDHPGTGTPQAVHNPHTHEAAEAGERHWSRPPTVAEAHEQALGQLRDYLHPWIESNPIGYGVFDFLHHSVTNWFMEHGIGDVLAPPGDRDKWDGDAMEAYTSAYQTLGSPNLTDRPMWTRDGQMVVHPWSRNGRGQWQRRDAFGPGPNQVAGFTAESERGPWQVHDQHPDDWVEATGLAWDARTGLPLERIGNPGKYMPADEVLVAADGTLWRISPQQYSGDPDRMRDITGSMLGDLWAGNKRPRGELFRPDQHTTVTVEPVGPSEDQRLVWAYQEAGIQAQLDLYAEVQAAEKQRESAADARVDVVIERGYEMMKQLQRTRDAVMEERDVTNALFNQSALPDWLLHRWSAELTVEEIPDGERFDPLRRAVRLRDKARAEHKARSDQVWAVNTMLTRRAAHVAEVDDPETTASYQRKVPWVVVPRSLTDPLIVVAPPLEDSPATLPELERLHAETFTPEERSLVAIQEAVDSTGRGPGGYGVDPVLAELAGDGDKLEAALREAEVLTATHQGSMPGLSRAAATAAAIAASAGGRAFPLYEIRGVDPKGAPPRRYSSGGSAPASFGDPNVELWERLDQDMQNATKRQHQYADEAGGLYELHKVREGSGAEALLRVLAEIRPMGGTIDYETTAPRLTGQGDLLGEFFPTAWVEASNVERMRFIPATRKEQGRTLDRGFYDGLRATPVIASDGAKTTLHELGHRMEHRVPGLHDVVRAFYERRTRGEATKKLNELRPNSAYEDHEVTRPDAFGDPYMGKSYPAHRNSEIVSMAIPALFGAAEHYGLDPEMEAFVLGLLAGEGETDG